MPGDPPELDYLRKKAKVDFLGKKIHDLLPRMHKMSAEGLLHKEKKEFEKAFILFTRYIELYEYIKKQKEYKLNPKSYKLPNHRAVSDVQTSLEYVKKCLIDKYTAKSLLAPKNGSNNHQILTNDDLDTDVPFKLPETPTDIPMSEPNGFINCPDFYKITKQTGSKHIIIDVRPEKDYQNSAVMCENIMNIPEEIIEKGVIASKLETKLREQSPKDYYLFKSRGKKNSEFIILLDWSTTHSNITADKPIAIMKSILIEWDTQTPSDIFILEGGFSELLHTFPMIISNPSISPPSSNNNNVSDEILDGYPSPDWMEEIEMKQSPTQTHISSNYNQNNIVVSSNDYKINQNPNDFIEETGKINQISRDVSQIFLRQPVVDRSGKPTVIFASEKIRKIEELIETNKKLDKLEKQMNNLIQNSITCLSTDGRFSQDYDDPKTLKDQIIAVQLTIDGIVKDKKGLQEELDALNRIDKTISKGDEQTISKLSLDLQNLEMRLHSEIMDRNKNQQKLESLEANKQEKLISQMNNGQIHKEPLKSEGSTTNSRLKRSLSSPNLAKVETPQIPMIDRTTKPAPVLKQRYEMNNNRRLHWKDRTVNMNPVYRDGHPGITGLKNLGNSCYMNSIIQCLSNTVYLTKYFIDGGYEDDLNTGSDNETQGYIAGEFAQVMRALWRGHYKSIAPRDLKEAIGQFRQQFHSHEQQDSHEFLTFLLEWMHNDLKKDTKLRIESKMSPAEKAWDKELKGQASVISNLFIGQLRSTIQCQICNKKSITYETFSSLSISLPESNRCTLDECIERFLRAQEIQGWTCPSCKTSRDATKKFDFVKLPPILVIHLNRFAGTTINLEKKNTYVTFPIEDLNLERHLVRDDDTKWAHTHSYSYNLYGLSNHYGSMDGGHYTAYCKNSTLDKWYKYDDQNVIEIAKNDVKTQNTSAYLLFYTSYVSYIDDR